MQPQKVSRNMRMPTTISRMAGSTARQASAASGGGGSQSELVPTEQGARSGVGCPQNYPPPLVGDSPVWLGKGYREQYCSPTGRTPRAQNSLWPLI